jgi:hypothetical protein
MRFPLLALVILSVFIDAATAQNGSGALRNAEETGTALFSTLQAGSFAGSEDVRNFEALQRAVEEQKCKGATLLWVPLPDRTHATQIFTSLKSP